MWDWLEKWYLDTELQPKMKRRIVIAVMLFILVYLFFPLSQREILEVHLCVCVGYVLAKKEIEVSFP